MSLEPTMRAVSLSGYVEVARFVGLEPFALLKKWNLSVECLDKPETRISAARFWGLIEESAARSHCDTFALLMCESRTFASLGPLSLLIKHLPNAREMVRTCIAYQRMLNDVVSIRMDDFDQETVISVDILSGFASRHAAEGAVAILHRILTGATDGVWQPERVVFRHFPPADRRTHDRFFNCTLSFEGEYDGLACPAHWMEFPNPSADPVLAKYALQLIDLIKPKHSLNSTVDHCRAAINLLLPDGAATLTKVAANLGLQPRKLQRLLEREGESFAGVLAQIRKDLAIRHLQSSYLKLTEVALMLGYSTLSSFSRWFEGEFGKSPSQWRADNNPRRLPK